MDKNELLKYKGKLVSICMLGAPMQFGRLTDVKNSVIKLENDRIGPICSESILAIGDYFA